jgi:hypothetical protein
VRVAPPRAAVLCRFLARFSLSSLGPYSKVTAHRIRLDIGRHFYFRPMDQSRPSRSRTMKQSGRIESSYSYFLTTLQQRYFFTDANGVNSSVDVPVAKTRHINTDTELH